MLGYCERWAYKTQRKWVKPLFLCGKSIIYLFIRHRGRSTAKLASPEEVDTGICFHATVQVHISSQQHPSLHRISLSLVLHDIDIHPVWHAIWYYINQQAVMWKKVNTLVPKLFARHPVSLAAVQPDNACLSIYIRGILILLLCLGWGRGGLGAGILWMLLFTGDRSKANQTLAWKKTTDYTSAVPHPTASILLDLLFEGRYTLLVWFVLPLAPVMTWWDDEKMKKNMAHHKSDRRVRDWPRNDILVPPSCLNLFQYAAVVELVKHSSVSDSLWGFLQSVPGASQAFLHWTQKGCGGAKCGLSTEASVTLKHILGPN